MKTIILAAAAALTLTAPAFADKYDGAGSLNEFVRQHFAQDHEPGDGARYFRQKAARSSVNMSTSNRDLVDFVRQHFAQDHEPGDGARYHRQKAAQSSVSMSTKNENLVEFVRNHLKNEGERGDN